MREIALLFCCVFSASAYAQSIATLRVTVIDPSGAVIVGATVTVQCAACGAGPIASPTGSRGEAIVPGLEPGRYTLHVESPGFEPYDARDVRLRSGETRRDVRLAIAKLVETVEVGRDPQQRASDPRGDAFSTLLGQAEIDELPDDPDEMERVLGEVAGPGAVMRVNGFRGGRLPPKNQIQQIRFRRNMFAADAHEPGLIFVDIVTKPGLENWRGATNIGFRDAPLNAKNAFAPVKGDERHQRYAFNLNGPLWKQHTSLSASIDGIDAFDSKTIVAALPSGYFADSVRKPNDSLHMTVRLEHALTKMQMLRVEAQRNHTLGENLGVGDFDLIDRGYAQSTGEQLLRASVAGTMRKSLYNELRLQLRTSDTRFDPNNDAPAVLVLNAFNAGGAQIAGVRNATEFELANDLDIAVGHHAIRTGVLVDGGRYRSNVQRNATGTFTFDSLAAYADGRPTTFTRNAGAAAVDVSQVEAGVYVQDDIRVRKDLTISAGVRQEVQSHIGGFHLGPRGGIVWAPFKSGNTMVRAGGGVFFDWFDAQSYEQAVQLDGTHQRIETVVRPGYPDPVAGGRAVVLPAGRVQLAANLTQPELREAMIGVEQQLPRDVRLQATYVRREGSHLLRGVNINAPFADGTRFDPLSGPITAVQSIAASRVDALTLNLNVVRPERRLFVAASYMLARSIDESDGPFSLPADSFNLAAERGPAPGDARHRFMSLVNAPLGGRFRIGTSIRVQSALPYNITTGRDDNGDTISNDRPAGVTRNSARGTAQADLGARLSWSIGFGTRTNAGAQGPQVRIVRGDNPDPLGSMPSGDAQNKRYALELYVQSYNVLNHVNALNFSGVMTSPFFARPTSAAPARRIEIGTRVSF